jgi:hypothetical protein
MRQTVEISLRVPSLRIKAADDETSMINNTEVRFTKRLELPSIPRIGDVLTMSAGQGPSFLCEVVRTTWRDDENLFVVACRYARQSITADSYRAIANSSDWTSKTLL